MKPGRIPKPTNLKLVQGNPGHRPMNKGEVSPEVGVPDCPAHLSAEAKSEWDRITPLLFRYRLISNIDTAALALYCQSYGRWQQAEREIEKLRAKGGDGLLVKAPSGYPIQNPYLAIANRAAEDCYKYLQQFGMSPSARTRVTVTFQGDLFGNEKTGTEYFT
jgi:P27 family predicted phage terminase small subunit